MKISCPSCNTILSAENVNVATDVAACPNCDEVFAISAIVSAGHEVDDDFDIRETPSGTSFQHTETGWRIVASTRSPMAFFLVPFMCVWSGFSLGGIYGSQIAAGKFNAAMSLFGIPFLLGTLLLGSVAVMSVCGRLVVSVDRDKGRVFVGVGPLGWTRRFNWSKIKSIEEDYLGYSHSGGHGRVVSLNGQSCLKFGSMLSETRRYYIVRSLRKLLAMRGN